MSAPALAVDVGAIITQSLRGHAATQGYYVSVLTEFNELPVSVNTGEIIAAGIKSGARAGHGWMEYVSAQEGYYGVNAVGSFIDPLGSPRVGVTTTTQVTTYATAYLNGITYNVYLCNSSGVLSRTNIIH